MNEKAIIPREKFNELLNDKYRQSRIYIPNTFIEAIFFEIRLNYLDALTQTSLTAATKNAVFDFASNCAAELRKYYMIEDEI